MFTYFTNPITLQEILKQSNSIGTIIDFVDFERYSKSVTQLAASIMMNLCSSEEGKRGALASGFIKLAKQYIKCSGWSSPESSLVVKRLLGSVSFVAVLVEAKLICIDEGFIDLCLDIVENASQNLECNF